MGEPPRVDALCLVIPAFDEERRLPIDEIEELASDPRVRLVFVDDGSGDGTAAILAALAERFERVEVVTLPENVGKGEAVRRGLQHARATEAAWVGYFDADMATPAREVLRLVDIALARPELEVVMGSRVALLGRDIERSSFRHYTGRVFATIASLTLDKPVYDTQCGAKLLRAGAALDTAIDRPFQSRWAFDVELLSRLDQAGVPPSAFWEEPLAAWRDAPGSRRSIAASVTSTMEVLALRDDLRFEPVEPDEPAIDHVRPATLHRFGLAVIVVSVVAHLWRLGSRPLAHDEAIDAWFSWQARSFGVMRYDPVYHGPLRFYLEGFVLEHFGTSAGWARLVAALAGIATTVIIARSTSRLGRFGAPMAALVFTVSPTALTVTRTGREDSLVALVSVGLLLVVAAGLARPRPRLVVSAGALLAVSATLKETTLIFGFAGACFFSGLAVVAMFRPAGTARSFVRRLRGLGTRPWMWSTVAFLAVFVTVYSSMFRYSAGVRSGFVDGIEYWLSQHDVQRGSQRWFFYVTIYIAYEWFVIGLATVGAMAAVRRRSIVGAWFITMAVVQFAVYSWAGEKFAWLAIHPLLPVFLLAGIGAEVMAGRVGVRDLRTRRASIALVGGMAAMVLATGFVAIRPAITAGDDPRELLVTVQTSRDVPEIVEQMAAGRRAGTLGAIMIDDRDSGSWPWAWYLHGFPDVAWATLDPGQPLPTGYDAYVVSASGAAPQVPAGYEIRRFVLRGWWLPDYGDVSVGDLARWFVDRTPWSPLGSSDQYLVIRTGAAA